MSLSADSSISLEDSEDDSDDVSLDVSLELEVSVGSQAARAKTASKVTGSKFFNFITILLSLQIKIAIIVVSNKKDVNNKLLY